MHEGETLCTVKQKVLLQQLNILLFHLFQTPEPQTIWALVVRSLLLCVDSN